MSEVDPVPRYVLEPLLDAGLALDDVRTLLLRVTFASMVGDGHDLSDIRAFLGDQPLLVRAAWGETINRMLGTHELPTAT